MKQENNYIEFKQVSEGEITLVRIPSHSTIDEACLAFNRFLRGAGYYFNGVVAVVEDTKEEESDLEINWSDLAGANPDDGVFGMAGAGPLLSDIQIDTTSEINLSLDTMAGQVDNSAHSSYYYDYDRHQPLSQMPQMTVADLNRMLDKLEKDKK